jgi:hypothetical protein
MLLTSRDEVMRNVVLLLFVMLLSFFTPVSYSADSTRSADVITLLELTGSYKLAMQTMSQVLNAVHDNFNRRNPDKKISDEMWSQLVNDSIGELDKESYYKMMVPIYEKYLSAEDVREITAFYKTPVGRKFISIMPDIMKDAGVAAQEWSKKAMQRIIPKIEQRLREMGYPGRSLG